MSGKSDPGRSGPGDSGEDPEAAKEDREKEEDGEKDRKKEEGASDDENGQESRRPISVRDLMPSPSTRPARRPPDRVERRGRGGGEGREGVPDEEEEAEEPSSEEAVDGEEGRPEEEGAPEPADEGAGGPAGAASVPTPVRVAMDAPPPGDSRPPEDLPSRRFEVDGEEWIVRISGRTVTGTRPDAGALLMHLSFFRPDEPESALRGLITVDRPLDALYEEDLLELFERSRPMDREGIGSG